MKIWGVLFCWFVSVTAGFCEDPLNEKLEGFYQRQQFDDAVGILEGHLKGAPDDRRRRVELAKVLDHVGRSADAIAALEGGVRGNEDDAELWWHLGQMWMRRGDDGPNVTRSGGTVTYKPSKMTDDEEAKWKMAEYAKAVGAFETLLGYNPGHKSSAEFLALALKGRNTPAKFGDAAEYAEKMGKLVEAFPESVEIGLGYCDVLEEGKEFEKAIELLGGYLAKEPRMGALYRKLAKIEEASGKKAAAEESAARADFFEWMPPFCVVDYSPELRAKITALVGDGLEEAVAELRKTPGQEANELMGAVCWHHLSHGAIENACFAELEKRGEGDLLAALVENARSVCTMREGGRALARMKHPKAFLILSRLVEVDQRPVWINDAATSLGVLGDERAVAVLVEAADPEFREKERQRSEQDADFMGNGPLYNRVRCVLALGAFDTEESRAALGKAAENPDLALEGNLALYRLTNEAGHLEKALGLVEDRLEFESLVAPYLREMVGTKEAIEAVEKWEKENPGEKEAE